MDAGLFQPKMQIFWSDINVFSLIEHNPAFFTAINGYVYESGQELGFCHGEIVTWHVSSVGEQDYIQTATFYGHTFELKNREEDMLSLFPMTGETISMNMLNIGEYLI